MHETNYWWHAAYWAAVRETDESLMSGRILEALAAIDQRLLAPIEFDCDEDRAIKYAERALKMLKAERAMRSNGFKGPVFKSAQPQSLD
jgi:hypothetical protein